ncbi:hypothetical protein SEA_MKALIMITINIS3_55 [Mycobacterium phage MkaliMitinis3]|nr:hypothetical protein SEA_MKALIMITINIS3_55 [Mycobacterium phage MkaliMitinis3]
MALFKKSAPVIAPPKTVASITAGLSDTLAELEAHAEDQVSKAEFQKAMADQAMAAAAEHTSESERALTVAQNLKGLLGL